MRRDPHGAACSRAGFARPVARRGSAVGADRPVQRQLVAYDQPDRAAARAAPRPLIRRGAGTEVGGLERRAVGRPARTSAPVVPARAPIAGARGDVIHACRGARPAAVHPVLLPPDVALAVRRDRAARLDDHVRRLDRHPPADPLPAHLRGVVGTFAHQRPAVRHPQGSGHRQRRPASHGQGRAGRDVEREGVERLVGGGRQHGPVMDRHRPEYRRLPPHPPALVHVEAVGGARRPKHQAEARFAVVLSPVTADRRRRGKTGEPAGVRAVHRDVAAAAAAARVAGMVGAAHGLEPAAAEQRGRGRPHGAARAAARMPARVAAVGRDPTVQRQRVADRQTDRAAARAARAVPVRAAAGAEAGRRQRQPVGRAALVIAARIAVAAPSAVAPARARMYAAALARPRAEAVLDVRRLRGIPLAVGRDPPVRLDEQVARRKRDAAAHPEPAHLCGVIDALAQHRGVLRHVEVAGHRHSRAAAQGHGGTRGHVEGRRGERQIRGQRQRRAIVNRHRGVGRRRLLKVAELVHVEVVRHGAGVDHHSGAGLAVVLGPAAADRRCGGEAGEAAGVAAVHRHASAAAAAAGVARLVGAATGFEPASASQRRGRHPQRAARAAACVPGARAAVGRDQPVEGQRAGDGQPDGAAARAARAAPVRTAARAKLHGRQRQAVRRAALVVAARVAVAAAAAVAAARARVPPPALAEPGADAVRIGGLLGRVPLGVR